MPTSLFRRTLRHALIACILSAIPALIPAVAQTGAKNGEWRTYGGDPRQYPLLAARSDQRLELQQARSRVAVQDRQPGPAAGIQSGRHAADGQRRPLRHGRHAARRRRARCGYRRADLGAQRERGRARPQRPSPAFRPRTFLLDRWRRAKEKSASSMSRRATAWSRSTPRLALALPASARMASSI